MFLHLNCSLAVRLARSLLGLAVVLLHGLAWMQPASAASCAGSIGSTVYKWNVRVNLGGATPTCDLLPGWGYNSTNAYFVEVGQLDSGGPGTYVEAHYRTPSDQRQSVSLSGPGVASVRTDYAGSNSTLTQTNAALGAGTRTITLAFTSNATNYTLTISYDYSSSPDGARFISADLSGPTPLSLASASLTDAIRGQSYSAALSASGGSGTGYTFAVTGGALPSGVSLSTAGVISGTPTVAGTFNFTARVTDSANATATQNYSLVVKSSVTLGPFATAGLNANTNNEIATYVGPWPGPTGQLVYSMGGTPFCTVTIGTNCTFNPGAAGTKTITVTYAGDANYAAATYTGQVTYKNQNTLALNTPVFNTFTYPTNQTLQFTSTSNSPATVVWSAQVTGGSPSCSISQSGALTVSGTGECYVSVQQAETSEYWARSVGYHIHLTAPALVFSSSATWPGGTVGSPYTTTVGASGGSGSGYTFALQSGSNLPAGLSLASSGAVSGTPTAAGSFSFTLRVTDSANTVTTQAATLVIAKGTQTISFTRPADQTYAPSATVALTATGGASGQPISFASTTASVCTVSGATATLVGVGTCTITASQAGNANYNAAADVQQSFGIGVASQAISFTAPADITSFVPNASVALQATGGASGLPVTFASTTTSICTVSGTTATIVGAGVCAITASQAGNANFAPAADVTRSFGIGKAAQTISFTKPADRTFVPGGTVDLVATGGASGLSVTFSSTTTTVCTVYGTTATMVSSGTCTITASQAGNSNYFAAADVNQSFMINKADQTIVFTAPPTQVYVTGGRVTLNATGGASGSPITFASSTPAVCTVSGSQANILAAGVCTITASQAAAGSYLAAAPVTRSFTINQGATTIGVVAAQTSALIGQPVQFVAQVTPADATGTVTFRNGATTLCANVPLSGAAASCTASLAAAGGQAVTATYSGNGNYAPATASPVSIAVTDQTKKTTEVVAAYSSARNATLMSNGPPQARQVTRLQQFGSQGGGQGTGIAAGASGPAFAGRPSFGLSTDEALSPVARPTLADTRGPGSGPGIAERLAAFQSDVSKSGGISPVEVSGYATDSNSRLSFGTSLQQWRQYEADRVALRAAELNGTAGPVPALSAATADKSSRLDVWAQGLITVTKDRRTGSESDSSFAVVYTGVDYVLNPALLVGVLAQYDTMKIRSATQASRIDGRGWMAGPYATVRLHQNVFLQARAAAGRSTVDVSPFLTYSDTFDTTRWLASASLTGRFEWGDWRIEPTATLSRIEDRSEGYTDHFGVPMPSITSTLTEASAGPEFVYRVVGRDGSVIEPRIGAKLVWAESQVKGTSEPAVGGTPDGLRGRLELGIRASLPQGMSLSAEASYDGLGVSDWQSVSGMAGLRIPLR